MTLSSSTQTPISRWFVLFLMVVLCVVPTIAGGMRLMQIFSGADITEENARFLTAPIPIVLHILSSIIFSVIGILQFSPLRHCSIKVHRMIGYIVWFSGVGSAFTGLWMTLFYPWYGLDSVGLYVIRLIVGVILSWFLCQAVWSILNRDFRAHGRWMLRAYVLGMGAGTQVLTHIPFFIFSEYQNELTRTLCMGAGWVINLMVAEIILSKKQKSLSGALNNVRRINFNK